MHYISDKDIVGTYRESVSTNTKTYTLEQATELTFVQVEYTSDAVVGNRQFRVGLLDPSDNVIIDFHAGAVQAASLENHYNVLPGIYRETSFADNSIQIPCPKLFLIPAGYKLKLWDNSNSAAGISASDSMVISWQGIKLQQLK